MITLARVVLVSAGLALVIAGAFAWWVFNWLDTDNPIAAHRANPDPVVISVVRGSTTRAIATQLAQRGLVEHPRLWSWSARLLSLSATFKAGEFEFQGTESPRQLMHLLGKGNVLRYRVSLVEGWTVQQALDRLQRAEKLTWDMPGADGSTLFALLQTKMTAERWQQLSSNPAFNAFCCDHTDALPQAEGWLFPDTYSYTADSTASEVVTQAWSKMLTELDGVWQARAPELPYKNPAELLAMASIVEKETGERPIGGKLHRSLFAGLS